MIYKIHFTPYFTDRNKGIRAEKDVLFNLFHVEKQTHDNIKGIDAPDFFFHGYGIQCKSARATICQGTDYIDYVLNKCACDMFCYVCYKDSMVYFMDKADFLLFVYAFGFVDIDSNGKEKVRLRKESYWLVEWLQDHAEKYLSELN